MADLSQYEAKSSYELLRRNEELFNSLAFSAFRAVYPDKKISKEYGTPCFNQWMLDIVQEVVQKYPEIKYEIKLNDFIQELYVIWIEAFNDFQKNQPKTSVLSYMIRRCVWGMRDWIITQLRIVTNIPYQHFLEEDPPFLLNIYFLFYGTEIEPFDTLSPYERYLIFLKYREEKTIFEIANIVQKDNKTVRKQLKQIIDSLRRITSEKNYAE